MWPRQWFESTTGLSGQRAAPAQGMISAIESDESLCRARAGSSCGALLEVEEEDGRLFARELAPPVEPPIISNQPRHVSMKRARAAFMPWHQLRRSRVETRWRPLRSDTQPVTWQHGRTARTRRLTCVFCSLRSEHMSVPELPKPACCRVPTRHREPTSHSAPALRPLSMIRRLPWCEV